MGIVNIIRPWPAQMEPALLSWSPWYFINHVLRRQNFHRYEDNCKEISFKVNQYGKAANTLMERNSIKVSLGKTGQISCTRCQKFYINTPFLFSIYSTFFFLLLINNTVFYEFVATFYAEGYQQEDPRFNPQICHGTSLCGVCVLSPSTLINESKLTLNCLSLCCAVMAWWHVHGIPCNTSNDSWDRLQPSCWDRLQCSPHDPELD